MGWTTTGTAVGRIFTSPLFCWLLLAGGTAVCGTGGCDWAGDGDGAASWGAENLAARLLAAGKFPEGEAAAFPAGAGSRTAAGCGAAGGSSPAIGGIGWASPPSTAPASGEAAAFFDELAFIMTTMAITSTITPTAAMAAMA